MKFFVFQEIKSFALFFCFIFSVFYFLVFLFDFSFLILYLMCTQLNFSNIVLFFKYFTGSVNISFEVLQIMHPNFISDLLVKSVFIKYTFLNIEKRPCLIFACEHQPLFNLVCHMKIKKPEVHFIINIFLIESEYKKPIECLIFIFYKKYFL